MGDLGFGGGEGCGGGVAGGGVAGDGAELFNDGLELGEFLGWIEFIV